MAASPSPLPAARVAVLDRVRRGDHSVNALALALGITDNAVRLHLAALVRDGLVWRRGVRHSGRAGQPAAEYGLAAAGEIALSAAYAPALTALVWALAHETDPGAARALYAAAGKRLAASTPARRSGSLAARAGACAALVESLGGTARVSTARGETTLVGAGCPLSVAVRADGAACTIIESLLAEHSGLRVVQRCEHGEHGERGEHPACRFVLTEP